MFQAGPEPLGTALLLVAVRRQFASNGERTGSVLGTVCIVLNVNVLDNIKHYILE